MTTGIAFIFYLVVIVFSVVLHELSHGYMARRLGDHTAEAMGRLTLNPLKHLDPFGSVIFPVLLYIAHLPGIAWAKPVPYNPNNLYKDYKYGPLKVALAGPGTNLGLMVVFGLLARFMLGILNPVAVAALGFIALVNALLAIFNLIPLPPLDGSRVLPYILPRQYAHVVDSIGLVGLLIVLLFVYFFGSIILAIAAALVHVVAGGQVLGLIGAII
jgi:Zn-dependent protease